MARRSSKKKIRQPDITGLTGVNLIERIVLEMGFLWYPTGSVEAGIDGTIELRDQETGEVFNSIIQVQSKAISGSFTSETPTSFTYLCKERDLTYWVQGNAPVILVVSRPRKEEAYWISVKDYFNDPNARQTRKVFFDKQRHRFTSNNRADLFNLAMPEDSGLYLAPPPKTEKLYTNLLKVVSFAPHIFIAETPHRSPGEVWRQLSEQGHPLGYEWILKEKRIVSFHDLDTAPWNTICDVGTVERFDSDEWAYSDDPDRQRDFVQLLNLALRQKVRSDLLFHHDRKYYFFKPTSDLSSRSLTYTSLQKITHRNVFRGYPKKKKQNDETEEIAYYRHSAFKGYFVRIEDTWYLEITPTYHFTRDGQQPDRFSGEYVQGIKREERNPAVLGQVVMWADFLSRSPDLFTPLYPFLSFGDLQTFTCEVGIHDNLWLKNEEQDEQMVAQNPENQLSFFDDED